MVLDQDINTESETDSQLGTVFFFPPIGDVWQGLEACLVVTVLGNMFMFNILPAQGDLLIKE